MFDKVKNYGQVMTPDNIVNHMIDILNLTQKEINTSLFLDNSCGDGAFITGLLNRGIPKNIFLLLTLMLISSKKCKIYYHQIM